MDEITSWVLRVAEKELENVAQQIFEECIEVADYAIAQFYSAYTPTQYKRMHSFDYVCAPFKEATTSKGRKAYIVGIKVLQGVASGHKDPDEYVFHGVMEMGVHGTSSIAISTPPMDVLEMYFSKFG